MELEGTHVASGAGDDIVTEQDYDEYMRKYRERRRNIQLQELEQPQSQRE